MFTHCKLSYVCTAWTSHRFSLTGWLKMEHCFTEKEYSILQLNEVIGIAIVAPSDVAIKLILQIH
jgi:hypothetical protein